MTGGPLHTGVQGRSIQSKAPSGILPPHPMTPHHQNSLSQASLVVKRHWDELRQRHHRKHCGFLRACIARTRHHAVCQVQHQGQEWPQVLGSAHHWDQAGSQVRHGVDH